MSTTTTQADLHLVYRADSGALAASWHIAHKLLSPSTYSCDLCALTHGVFREQGAWRAFRERHPDRLVIWHRDDFAQAHPAVTCQPPCVLRQRDGRWESVLDAAAIGAIDTVDTLIARIETVLSDG